MHSPVRKDMTCLNCRHVVQDRFCTHCGQENTETRKTFHHLFLHFFEDLTHYENAFWKTIGNLVFRPGSLTKAYVSGRRVSYLAPVRLYIFISFVTFFIISLLPAREGTDGVRVNENATPASKHAATKGKAKDDVNLSEIGISTQREIDSIQRYGKPEDKLSPVSYWVARKFVRVARHNSLKQVKEKFRESAIHNFPKVLFIYMPVFALVLWLFHDKRKWYYFEHGIFTLHYFSFLLLVFLFLALFNLLTGMLPDSALTDILDYLVNFAALGYMLYYFFPAHHRFYGGSRRRTVFYGAFIFFINWILAGMLMIVFLVYTFINIE